MQKSIIREQIKSKRNALLLEEVDKKSTKIANNVICELFPKIQNITKKKIALYLSANNEVKTDKIIQYLAKNLKNQQIALPLINDDDKSLTFKKYHLKDKLITNKKYKNILEPTKEKGNIIPEIIFTPLVACDKNGNRVGMGKGFYDQTINLLRKDNPKIKIIGLAYNFQIVDQITANNFDQNLDFIICESGLIKTVKIPNKGIDFVV